MLTERGRQTLWTALGVSAGVMAGVWLWRRQQRGAYEREPGQDWAPPADAGGRVAAALRADAELASHAIEVQAISDGVVELGGRVATRDDAGRAVRIAQETDGVFTVVNRLAVASEEEQREETLRRREDGAPELHERGHTGMGVGMGTRRQSPDTDPDRPSDRQKILDRQLDVGNVEDAPESGPNPVSGAEAVESDTVKPGDEAAIRDAGLDPSPRPTSTPKESMESEGEREERESGVIAEEEVEERS
jgi:hypothetical protein